MDTLTYSAMPLVANAPLYTEHPYMSTSVIYFLTFLALWPLFRIFACRKLLRATQLCPQTKHSENCRNFLRLLFSRTVVVIMWVILVNMEISVILGHEKTKIHETIDCRKIDVFSDRTNTYIKNKKMGHLI